MRQALKLSVCAFAFALAGAAHAADAPLRAVDDRSLIAGTSKSYMVAAGTPAAAQAGAEMIKAGGNAVDAAVAIELVLTLTEPQYSGLGGGGFMLFWDAAGRQMHNYDGREMAPSATSDKRFLRPDGTAMPHIEAVVGGKSVGVPGALRMLELAHKKHGKLPWAKLAEPAIRLAEQGFVLTPHLQAALARDQYLKLWEPAKSYFYLPDGSAKPVGTVMKNPALAAVLRRIAAEGANGLYTGPVAADLVHTVTTAERNPSDMTVADMAGYEAKERTPLCATYRSKKVCTIAPPSSGGVSLLQTLAMIERFDLGALGATSVAAYQAMAEAGRLALADREVYLADPDFFPVPTKELIAPGYLAARAKLIDPKSRMHDAPAGALEVKKALNLAPGLSAEPAETTHFSIRDKDGNAVAMTATIEGGFGSKLMVDGFMLNNELTDFSYEYAAKGETVANRVEPKKRPRSAMAPTLIFDQNGKLEIVVGSPGGAVIPAYVAKTIVALLDWHMTPAEAAAAAEIAPGDTLSLEQGTFLEKEAAAFKALGDPVRVGGSGSGIHVIRVMADGSLVGGADPRRDGAVVGD